MTEAEEMAYARGIVAGMKSAGKDPGTAPYYARCGCGKLWRSSVPFTARRMHGIMMHHKCPAARTIVVPPTSPQP